MAQMHSRNVLILSSNYWHSLWFRRQRFAMLFADSGCNVLYVNPAFTLASYLVDKECRQIFTQYFRGVQKVSPNLRVLTLPPLVPLRKRLPTANYLSLRLSRPLIAREMQRWWGDEPYVQIVYTPEEAYRGRISASCETFVYECVDDHSEYPENDHLKEHIRSLERKLLAEVDLLSVTAAGLLDTRADLARSSVVVPNGVAFKHFRSAQSAGTAIPQDVAHIADPVAIYVGAVFEWFDLELVHRTAGLSPSVQFVIIGPTRFRKQEIEALRNIHYLGQRSWESLPGYLKKARVGLIPFKMTSLTRTVNPLKLYEYLAAGIPVVSVAMPEVKNLATERIIEIASNSDEFAAAISRLLLQRPDPNKCASIAEQFSWERLFDRLNSAIASLER